MSLPVEDVNFEQASDTMARFISKLLIAGVGLSALVLALGLGMTMITGRTGYHMAATPQIVFAPEGATAVPRTIGEVWQGAMALKPFAVIELGALLLIATPVLRVAASIVLFAVERDYLYALMTALVLVLLLGGLFWGV